MMVEKVGLNIKKQKETGANNTKQITQSELSNNLSDIFNLNQNEFNKITGLELTYFEKEKDYILVTSFANPNLAEEKPETDDYEWFQIFDQNDNSIIINGKKAIMYRIQCHKDKRIKCKNPNQITEIFHRGAVILIIDKNNNLLVPIRSETKDLYAGMGDVSTGEHVKHGEKYIKAAVRGVMEERKRKIKDSDLVFLGKRPVLSKDQSEFVSFYYYQTDNLDFNYGSETKEHKIINIKQLLKDEILQKEINFRNDLKHDTFNFLTQMLQNDFH